MSGEIHYLPQKGPSFFKVTAFLILWNNEVQDDCSLKQEGSASSRQDYRRFLPTLVSTQGYLV